jgi:hypothetical protein
MLTLPLDDLSPGVRRGATCVAALTHALAREERSGRRPLRLLEPGRATWNRFRGRLNDVALLDLLLEDAAVAQPVPFDPSAILGQTDAVSGLPPALVAHWLDALPALALDAAPTEYITAQAKLLGLPTRLNRSDLPRLKPHHRALELPGTGGQIAFHIAQTQDDIFLQDVFTIACGSPEELLLAGLVAVESRIPGHAPALLDPTLDKVRAAGATLYDFVFALDPEKGGTWTRERLAELFQANPNVRVVMV